MSDSAKLKPINLEPIERSTGRPWADWMKFMEGIGAADLSHAQIAQKVEVELGASVDNPGWWAQGITVAYEQQSGRRLPGQQADGTFQTSVSRTTDLTVQEALDKWAAFAGADRGVSTIVSGDAKLAGSEKRRTWRAKAVDGSSVMFTSELRPNGKTAVLVNHMRLSTQEENLAAKETWTAVLERFLRS